MSRLSSRSLLFTTPPPDRSADAQDVDHEDQRVGALDLGALVALGAVAQLRRNDEENAAPRLDALQSPIPALDDVADADDDGSGLATGVRNTGGLCVVVVVE